MRLPRSHDDIRQHRCGFSDAEMELISALRLTDDFLISIHQRDGRFIVSQNLKGSVPSGPRLGSGDTFEEAWDEAGLFNEQA